jgi:CRISPR-associated endonuclease Cas2
MFLVVSYDVNTTEPAGAKRLRKVARLCEKYGVRVQNSVFELDLDPAQETALRCGLEKIINHEKDSVRFYRLGKNWKNKVDSMGRKQLITFGGDLIL